jgi:hypothetical protein
MAATLELKLKEGDPAPEFIAQVTGGKQIALSELKGRYARLHERSLWI